MKYMAAILLTALAPASAQNMPAPNGPPAGFFSSAQNTGGTLYLTFCTPVGWPCYDFKQEVWGQICNQDFADSSAKAQWGVIFSRYTGWKCPGYVATEAAKRIGYGDGGPANVKIEARATRP